MLLRKLLTKPVWRWERSRTYPIRDEWQALPPIPVAKGSSRFAVLTTVAALPDAVWAAWSWFRFLQPLGMELQMSVDGQLDPAVQARVEAQFPGVQLFNVNPLVDEVCKGRPGLEKFFRHNRMAKQVALCLALSAEGPLLYSDHDVMAFNQPTELLAAMRANTPCYFEEMVDSCHDLPLVQQLNARHIAYIPRFNTGFLYIPQGTLSLVLAEEILATWNPFPPQYFTSQTLMSALLAAANAAPLAAKRYVISNQRQFYFEADVDYGQIAARHFTGPVRHVLYKRALPWLAGQNRSC